MKTNWFNKTHVKIKCHAHQAEEWSLPISGQLISQERTNSSDVVNQMSDCGINCDLGYSTCIHQPLPIERISTDIWTANTEHIVEGNSHTNSHEWPASLERGNHVQNSKNNFQMGNFDRGQSGGNFDSGYSTQTHRQFLTGMSIETPNKEYKKEGSHQINSHERTPPFDGVNQAPLSTNDFQSGQAAIGDHSDNFDSRYSIHPNKHLPTATRTLTPIPEYKMTDSDMASKNNRTTPGGSNHGLECFNSIQSGNVDSGYYPSEIAHSQSEAGHTLPPETPLPVSTCTLKKEF